MSLVLSRGLYDPLDWRDAGQMPRALLSLTDRLRRSQLEQSVLSPKDGFQKLLFRAHDGLAFETVIIPLERPDAVTICISSQVGCAMGCTFCATARLSQRRNLETWEIMDQLIQAREIVKRSGKSVTGVVFMGMGEPFLNYDRVIAAARLMCYPLESSVSAKAITISTVGILDKIHRFIDEAQPFRLSISIGAATDSKRAELVPIAARTPIATIMHAARRYALARNDRVMIAYVCISGENVGEEDAQELARVIGSTPVRLDLIPVTDSTGRYQPPDDGELSRFRDALRRYLGQPVVRRYSGGADIQAACGTLAGV